MYCRGLFIQMMYVRLINVTSKFSIYYPIVSHIQSAQRYPDLYVLCGDTYSDIRQSLVQSAFDESVQTFVKAVQVCVYSTCV